MLNFRFEPPSEQFEGDLNMLPPPIFSRTSLPILYNYKAPPSTVPSTFINASGEEVTRMVNKDRYKSAMPLSLSHYDTESPVPTEPPNTKPANSADEKRILASIKKVRDLLARGVV
jgi:general transcription factor 3C polypeptide 5 (transcription factor C subunit 1)